MPEELQKTNLSTGDLSGGGRIQLGRKIREQKVTGLPCPSSFRFLLFSIQALTSSQFSSVIIQISSLKYVWICSNISPLALKRILLNSGTAVPVHIVLNNSHGVINPTSIIDRITYQYIVSRVMMTEKGLSSVQPSFCALFLPNNPPLFLGSL